MLGSATRSREWIAGFLESIGAREAGHTDRTLLEHLLGTFDLLRDWECELDVCIAGGLHSIYGTNAFTHGCIAWDEREEVEQMVGQKAARLVRLFHSTNRPRAILMAFETCTLVDRHSGESIATDKDELRDLLAIECANLVEQAEGIAFLRGLANLPPAAAQSLLSTKVFEAVKGVVTSA